jgi:urease gamma subunit
MTPFEQAMQGLAQRYGEATKAVTDRLIAINRLDGESAAEIIKIADTKLVTDRPVDGATTTVLAGVISGLLSGLGADLVSGGLTLGTGALVGGVLGATAAAALAKGYNVYTNKDRKVVGWSPDSLTEAFGKALMLYLAIAHFGRGQGQWRRREDPQAWSASVNLTLNRQKERLHLLWQHSGSDQRSGHYQNDCATLVRQSVRGVLLNLYPESSSLLPNYTSEAIRLTSTPKVHLQSTRQ